MHTVIRTYTGSPSLADEIKARGKDVEAQIGTVPGFIAYYLVKTKDGAISVTVCEDKQGCEESSKRAANFLREKMPNVKAGTPQITEGDLVFKFATYKTSDI